MPDTHSTTPHDASPAVEVPATPIAFGRATPGIGVRDIRAAYDFYAGVLGFTKASENGDPVHFMVLKNDAAEIYLLVSEGHTPPEANVGHIFVSNAAAVHAVCEAKGIRIIKGLTDQDYGQRAFVLAEPDGLRLDPEHLTRLDAASAPVPGFTASLTAAPIRQIVFGGHDVIGSRE